MPESHLEHCSRFSLELSKDYNNHNKVEKLTVKKNQSLFKIYSLRRHLFWEGQKIWKKSPNLIWHFFIHNVKKYFVKVCSLLYMNFYDSQLVQTRIQGYSKVGTILSAIKFKSFPCIYFPVSHRRSRGLKPFVL